VRLRVFRPEELGRRRLIQNDLLTVVIHALEAPQWRSVGVSFAVAFGAELAWS
jgi:hypothetical protein